MRLYTSAPSPFGRKVKITAHLVGVFDQIQCILIDANDADSAAKNPNPLAKIPTLELDSGEILLDSQVICLHLLREQGLLERCLPSAQISAVLTRAAVADGLMEAALLMVYERRFRPAELVSDDWLHRQNTKVLGALAWLDQHRQPILSTPTLDQIGLACALGYLDFRFQGEWRTRFKALAQWLAEFQQMVPAYRLTDPEQA
ncbi:MAG: glutathione S-transferase family protein [Gammaproteobacteria bacterium]|nr:glutathione S-transferase family protein [Gammaproteobacteria bacterium]